MLANLLKKTAKKKKNQKTFGEKCRVITAQFLYLQHSNYLDQVLH